MASANTGGLWVGVYDTDTDSDHTPFVDETTARAWVCKQIGWMSEYIRTECMDGAPDGFARAYLINLDGIPVVDEFGNPWNAWDHIANYGPTPFWEWCSDDPRPCVDNRWAMFTDHVRRALIVDRDGGVFDGHTVTGWGSLHDVVDANTYVIDALNETMHGWTFDDDDTWEIIGNIVELLTSDVFGLV